ncbi:putative quinol monooxygenase [Shewanella woodyi]|uniref:Antibiotic biosynthesis monooxygenase n=1 Tax=Shewanella woodyi (strain ATCC 51908 / MS32) TaxID=392500 RepID=B1KG23_SHEWM|nr:putative quinol monooxygenase [Shewanella woodyi]ACA86730.1 Antibiotic biosynthesis monooxygenase [Shewanella woodyi ATCC 51908]
MANLTIQANIIAKPGKIQQVKTALLKLIELTRAEAGCVNYDLHQDNENPAHFMFYENWTSRELWQQHMSSAHIETYIAETQDCVEQFTLSEMTQIA